MPSSGYAAITFVANEQPTTAKWNLIGSNDASFNTGAGFNDNILATRHFTTNTIQSIHLALSAALDATNGVKSYANGGNAGGTFYYINLGGIKLLWGYTASLTTNNTFPNYVVTYPVGFFTTIQSISPTVISLSATGDQLANLNQGVPPSTVQATLGFFSSAAGTAVASLLVIGT